MRFQRADAAGLRAMERAVRAGEPVVHAVADAASGPPADELVPLCHAVEDASLARWLPPGARPGAGFKVSVVIPAARGRPIGLAALAAQDVETELIVLANGPWREGVVVPWEGHGRTRQRGVALARHPYVLFTVDDALPLGAGFVRTLVEALEAGGYDAVLARQLPWPTSDAVTRARLRRWTPPEGRGDATLDNVAALYRRSALLADPFDDVPIAEDWAWGRRHRFGYVAGATVVHAHPRRFRALYTRTRDLHRQFLAAGEPARVPDLATFLRAAPSVVGSDLRGGLAELCGQWAAARATPRR